MLMIVRRPLLFVIALLVASPAAFAGGYLHLSGLSTKLSGTLTDEVGGLEPLTVNLDRDIGFGYDYGLEARAGLRSGIHRLSVAGAAFDHHADRSLSGFDFSGTEFEADAEFDNRLRWAELEYGIAPIPIGLGRLEFVLGARLYRYEGEASGTGRVGTRFGSVMESVEVTAPVPHVGAQIELNPIPFLVLRGGAKGIFLGIDNDEGSTLDLEASAGLKLGGVEVGAGLRRFDVTVSIDGGETAFDFDYRGFQVYVRFGG